jgi:hypothetical protein
MPCRLVAPERLTPEKEDKEILTNTAVENPEGPRTATPPDWKALRDDITPKQKTSATGKIEREKNKHIKAAMVVPGQLEN